MISPPKKTMKTGSGKVLNEVEWEVYRATVYEYFFYNDKKWTFDGQSVFYGGCCIHYSDFMRAKRGYL